jgi:Carbamoyltransferase C-terminus
MPRESWCRSSWKRFLQRNEFTPVLLNTSFNENEPIVHRPGEALDCFLRTDMDVLVLGLVVLTKARTGALVNSLSMFPVPEAV